MNYNELELQIPRTLNMESDKPKTAVLEEYLSSFP